MKDNYEEPNQIQTFGRFQMTAGERIADVPFFTGTHGHVIVHSAPSIQAAGAGTRISTLFVDAGLLAGTVRADNALGATVGRHSDVTIEARTRRITAGILALRIRPTRRGYARMDGCWR